MRLHRGRISKVEATNVLMSLKSGSYGTNYSMSTSGLLWTTNSVFLGRLFHSHSYFLVNYGLLQVDFVGRIRIVSACNGSTTDV